MDVDTIISFQKHPDRFKGTWWPVRVGRYMAARISCPRCGEVQLLRVTVHGIKDDGSVGSPVLCPNEKCWVGRVKLNGWEN